MQIGGGTAGGGDYVSCFSKIKKHVGVSTRGVYDPLAGIMTLTLSVRVVTPAIGSFTPPSTYPSVFLISIVFVL